MTIGAWNASPLHRTFADMTSVAAAVVRGPTKFGVRRRTPRPALLVIVFGLFLMIVGVTATAQTVLVTMQVSNATLGATLSSDAATVRTFVNGLVRPQDLTAAVDPSRLSTVETGLSMIAKRGEILRIEIRDPAGVVRLSNAPNVRGLGAAPSTAYSAALAGHPQTNIVSSGPDSEALGETVPAKGLIREYFPLVGTDAVVQGVVAIWRDDQPVLDAIATARNYVVLVTLSAAFVVAVILFLIFRAAQRRIVRQTEQLVEAERLDALTGMPNHGTLVAELAVGIDAATRDGESIGVILADLDNFRLVNDTYGHDAGDTALLQLSGTLAAILPEGMLAGRYGPDEFLVVARGVAVAGLEAIVADIQNRLGSESLAIEAAERLPITISAGIAVFPDHAASVTELLSTVAVVLAEAKASGGNATRAAGRAAESTAETRSFDVLQGLIFAVDTKDRYTKRHSEDVARYGVFLAQRLGVEAEVLEGIRMAGLLHDIGKIGIPDAVLRKPGRLTDAEYDIVKQHVALGDSIVRNVANIDLVRAGVRHHHERWDGKGYLHALAGNDIPLVARILAVADAFSAMTTTRPYRKALSVEEALRRLGDAAGTQLDERLAAAFIRGIETAPNAPMPGDDRIAVPLWVPSAAQVA